MQNKDKFLVIQYRTDASLEHERKCIVMSTGLGEDDFLFYNVFDEQSSYEELFRLVVEHQYPVILAGSGEYYLIKHNDDEVMQARIDLLKQEICPIVKYIVANDIPLLGLCFGHQVVALCLGGEVEYNQAQMETGIFEIEMAQRGLQSPIFKDMPETFNCVLGHQDSVVSAPEGALHLASSGLSKYQGLEYNERTFTFQFHPELNRREYDVRISLYPSYNPGKREGSDAEDVVEASRILKNFCELAGKRPGRALQ